MNEPRYNPGNLANPSNHRKSKATAFTKPLGSRGQRTENNQMKDFALHPEINGEPGKSFRSREK